MGLFSGRMFSSLFSTFKYYSAAPCILTIFLALALTGCTSIGTRELPKNRMGFADAMINSEEQQLLLNIVRIHFEDRPYFVNVDSITTSTNMSLNVGSSYDYSESPSNPSTNSNLDSVNNALVLTSKSISNSFSKNWSLNASPNASYSDSPTISYSPLQGDKFTAQMLAPISIETLHDLLSGGWRAEKVMRLLVDSVGKYENGIFPYKDVLPEYKGFRTLIELILDLQKKKMIIFDLEDITTITVNAVPSENIKQETLTIPAIKALVIIVFKDNRNSPEVKKLYRILGIKGNPGEIKLVNNLRLGMVNKDDNIVAIRTRCFLSMLDFLSYAVKTPPDLIQKGIVQAPRYPDGKYFDLTKLTDGLLTIYMTNQRPHGNTSVEVNYRNHWFYIADNDSVSKRTFALVEQLFNLQAGPLSNSGGPVLTIPVR